MSTGFMEDEVLPAQGRTFGEDLTASRWLRKVGEAPILCERSVIGMIVWRRFDANAGRKARTLFRHCAMPDLNGECTRRSRLRPQQPQWLSSTLII